MPMSEWRAVIFDLDDTLYPEEQFVLGGLQAVSRAVEGELGISQQTVWEELQRTPPGHSTWQAPRYLA